MNAGKQWTFDSDLTREYTKVRQQFIAKFLEPVRHQLELVSAVDLGCGIGYFSKFLSDMGFRVVAVDGREKNVLEGQRRHPEITFLTRNVEDPVLSEIGSFDLALCVGLLYHLENPFRAIRNLHALTTKVLLVESMCVPGEDASMQLLDESLDDNQGLDYVAFYPTEACLVKMLYRAGFPFVYRFQRLPEDDQFITTPQRARSRTFLAASKVALTAPNLALAEELKQPIVGSRDPWTPATNGIMPRAWRFLKKPSSEKRKAFYFRWAKTFPNTPAPLRLPFGAWWLVRNDNAGRPISEGKFEAAELAFVQRFLKQGMTVLDIGAHHGLYTLLASKRVGRSGKVIAFEPSPRERKALRLHLKLNRCKNVEVQDVAVGDSQTVADLYVVDDWEAGCNSLRPPDTRSKTTPVSVNVVRLGDWLAERKIERVDFVKLDVEGAELAVLKGAGWFLENPPRPVILAELQDVRARPWGYLAKDVAVFAESLGFRWFALLPDGKLTSLAEKTEVYEGNFVAIPPERLRQFSETTQYATGA